MDDLTTAHDTAPWLADRLAPETAGPVLPTGDTTESMDAGPEPENAGSIVTLVLAPLPEIDGGARVLVTTAGGQTDIRYLSAEDAAVIRHVVTGESVSLVALRRERRWTQADFCRAFERTSRVLGRPLGLSARQVRRWEGAHPPRPLPEYARVLEAMYGLPITALGFPPPPYHAERRS